MSPPDYGAGRRHFDPQEEIKQVILDRQLRKGAAIPSETELMGELGISRSTLREAIKGLQARGIVTVQHGRGTFVGEPSLDSLVDSLVFRGQLAGADHDLSTASDLVDIRDVLETALVQRVAQLADEALVAELGQEVDEMERSVELGEGLGPADRRFHEKLYQGLGNRLMIELVRSFWQVLDAVGPKLPAGLTNISDDLQHHRRILQRVAAHDPDGAGTAMREHFRATHEWVQGEHAKGADETE